MTLVIGGHRLIARSRLQVTVLSWCAIRSGDSLNFWYAVQVLDSLSRTNIGRRARDLPSSSWYDVISYRIQSLCSLDSAVTNQSKYSRLWGIKENPAGSVEVLYGWPEKGVESVISLTWPWTELTIISNNRLKASAFNSTIIWSSTSTGFGFQSAEIEFRAAVIKRFRRTELVFFQ